MSDILFRGKRLGKGEWVASPAPLCFQPGVSDLIRNGGGGYSRIKTR